MGALEQSRGKVLVHGRRDEHLFRLPHELRQPTPAAGVQLREHVVQDQHRSGTRGRVVGHVHVPGPQAQREGDGPGLPVGRVALGGCVSQADQQIVPVRTHQGDAALALLALHSFEGVHHEPVEVRHGEVGEGVLVRTRGHGGALVLEPDVLGALRELLVGTVHLGLQGLEKLEPRGHQSRAGPCQLVVPHRERRPVRVREGPGTASGLEQGVALLQRTVVVRTGRGEHGPHGRGEVVQEPPPVGRITLHQGEVLGGEQHGVQCPERLPGAHGCGAVDPHAVGPRRIELVLQHRALPTAVHPQPDDRTLRVRGDQGPVAGDTVGGQGRGPVDRLHDVGLAHAVGTGEHRESRSQCEVQTGVGPVVQQREVVYEHTITGWADGPA